MQVAAFESQRISTWKSWWGKGRTGPNLARKRSRDFCKTSAMNWIQPIANRALSYSVTEDEEAFSPSVRWDLMAHVNSQNNRRKLRKDVCIEAPSFPISVGLMGTKAKRTLFFRLFEEITWNVSIHPSCNHRTSAWNCSGLVSASYCVHSIYLNESLKIINAISHFDYLYSSTETL